MKNIFKSKKSILVSILTIALLICSTVILTACNNDQDDTKSNLPVYEPGSIALQGFDADFLTFGERPYRYCYYEMSYAMEFIDLLLTEEQQKDCYEWFEEEGERTNYGEYRDECLFVSFIKRYNIPKEDFENALEKIKEDCKENNETFHMIDGKLIEENEFPNPDIIYTFDEDIIREYYRYE